MAVRFACTIDDTCKHRETSEPILQAVAINCPGCRRRYVFDAAAQVWRPEVPAELPAENAVA